MARSHTASSITAVAALCAALGGCSTRSNVSAIGNTPPLYTHVYVTAQAVWFNSNATAGPDDGGWAQFPLTTPITVDLVADSNGNFAYLATDLKLAPGSYSQVRLIPLDNSLPLAASAQTLGASYNMEADYVDSSGNTQQLPLELLNPDKGFGIQTSLTVQIGSVGAGALSSGVGTPTSSTTSPFGGTTTGTTTGTTVGTTSGTTSSTGTSTTAEFALLFDGGRDLTAFNYPVGSASVSAAMLSSHITAADLAKSGGIQGQLTLTNLTTLTSANGTPGIEVSAESLTADGSRHYVVASAPVAADGSFTLYPLAANSSNNESYDIVIHGAGIATIIIKDIIIPPVGSTGLSTSSLTGGSASITSTADTTSTGTTTTGTTTSVDNSPITPANLVSIGTLIPRGVTPFTANITSVNAPLPAGAAVSFYQTLPGSGEAPYVIESDPIDPFNQVLGNAQALSSGTVDSGTYVSSGATVTVVSAAPAERAGTYRVAATAPFYNDGNLASSEVTAPATSTTTTTTTTPAAPPATPATLTLASGVSPGIVSATIKPATPNKYDSGYIMLSQNGQLVAAASLASVIKAGGSVQLTGVPSGSQTGVYYVTVRAWCAGATCKAGALGRQWYPNVVDLQSATSASVQLTVN